MEFRGQPIKADSVKAFQIGFKGEKLEITDGTKIMREGTFAIDPDAKPKALDFTPKKGAVNNINVGFAIYKLDGDKLTICVEEQDGKKRPTEFKSTAEQTHLLITLERVKEKK